MSPKSGAIDSLLMAPQYAFYNSPSTPIADGVDMIITQGLQYKVQNMTGTEPLNEDGSSPHHEAWNVRAQDGG